MAKGIIDMLKDVCNVHYLGNFMLSTLFMVLKVSPLTCHVLFENCNFELREMEILTFLGCVIVLKNRRKATFMDYIDVGCMFSKVANAIMFFRHNPLFAVAYVLLCLVHLVTFPRPVYGGPESITYFSGSNLQEELERDRRVTWLIEFYATWQPSCVSFAPVFSELSSKYTLDNIKFGKIDASRYPEIAKQFRVDSSAWSKQLPTVILFENGKEKMRRPHVDYKGRYYKFAFTMDNVIQDFELNEVYLQCKKHPINKKEKNKDQKKTENSEMNTGDSKDKTE